MPVNVYCGGEKYRVPNKQAEIKVSVVKNTLGKAIENQAAKQKKNNQSLDRWIQRHLALGEKDEKRGGDRNHPLQDNDRIFFVPA